MARSRTAASQKSSASLGFEAKRPVRKDLAADKLRSNMDAAATERSDKRRHMSEPYKRIPPERADYVLANPPFNDSDCFFRQGGDVRWAT